MNEVDEKKVLQVKALIKRTEEGKIDWRKTIDEEPCIDCPDSPYGAVICKEYLEEEQSPMITYLFTSGSGTPDFPDTIDKAKGELYYVLSQLFDIALEKAVPDEEE